MEDCLAGTSSQSVFCSRDFCYDNHKRLHTLHLQHTINQIQYNPRRAPNGVSGEERYLDSLKHCMSLVHSVQCLLFIFCILRIQRIILDFLGDTVQESRGRL